MRGCNGVGPETKELPDTTADQKAAGLSGAQPRGRYGCQGLRAPLTRLSHKKATCHGEAKGRSSRRGAAAPEAYAADKPPWGREQLPQQGAAGRLPQPPAL